MQYWTSEMWQAAAIGFVVGLIIGCLVMRLTGNPAGKQAQTEAELKQVKAQVEAQKEELEKHFAESADLLKTLAQDYQKLYKHLATTSAALLPELTDKPLFNGDILAENTESQNSALISGSEPVKDYSEGSSGILRAEK